MTKKTKFGLISILLWIVFATGVAIAGVLYYQINTIPIEYTEVEVRIANITYEPDSIGYGSHAIVTVTYEGKNYELISVIDGEMPRYEANYQTNLPITVYLSNGELYSNVKGIHSHNIKGRMYGMMVGISAAAFLAAASVTGAYADVLKKERKGVEDGKNK